MKRHVFVKDEIRNLIIEECAQVADARALAMRAKAKAVKMPQRQSYFAQSIEARVIAEHIRALSHSSQDGGSQ